jgi:hypothetical protein
LQQLQFRRLGRTRYRQALLTVTEFCLAAAFPVACGAVPVADFCGSRELRSPALVWSQKNSIAGRRLRQSRHDQIHCLVLPQIITGEAKKLSNQ